MSELAKALREYIRLNQESRQYDCHYPARDVLEQWRRVLQELEKEEREEVRG